MKQTMTAKQMANDLMNDSNANWSREGAEAMAEYLLQLDEDCGVDSEWDVVAVRCEYFEAANALEAYADMGGLKHGEQCSEEQARDILEWNTTVIEVGKTGRVIVANY